MRPAAVVERGPQFSAEQIMVAMQGLSSRQKLNIETRDQLPDHEVDHIVGVPLGVNAIEFPAPTRCVMIEAQQSFFGQRGEELNREERIAACLLVHKLRQRGGGVRLATKRIRDEPPQIVSIERRKANLLR